MDELALYYADHNAWMAYVAPNMVRQIVSGSDEMINRVWPSIPEDYKRAVWKLLPDEQRQRIRTLRGGK